MTTYNYNAVVKELNGAIDNVNKIFTTDERYVPGTIRLIWNGQVYEADDTRHGWTEIDDQTVETDRPPRPSDELQAFYQNKDSETIGLENVVGSPFDPRGILP
jgi:hypothetical protein